MNHLTQALASLLHAQRYLNNSSYRKAMQLMNKGEKLSADEMQELQHISFLNLFQHAYHNIPFYHKKYSEAGIDPASVKDLSDLGKLPVLTKDEIKKNFDKMLWDKLPTEECPYSTSGGTTGEPMKIYQDWGCYYMEKQAYYRGLKWMGWKPGYGMVRLFGGSLGGRQKNIRFYIRKTITGEMFLPAFELRPDNARAYLDEIRDMGETFVQGYCSTIFDLALYVKKFNYKGLKVKGIFTTAEQLAGEQAAVMKEAFGCEVKSFYGCGEINSVGFQTIENGAYLVPDEINIVENHKDHISDHNFLITSLHNYKMPLIRYLNGDAGIIHTPAMNGLNRHSISELQGRTADMFVRPDGSYISSILATQTMQISGLIHKIKKYQLIQTGPVQMDIIYTCFDEDLTPSEQQHIVEIYRQRMGASFDISIRRTDTFITSASGKHRLMIRQYNPSNN